ncbi:MAG: Gfo/Idh/MocA family oxidoreductase, partial [Actinomycetota bacterium]
MEPDRRRLRLAIVGCGAIADTHVVGAERVGARIDVTVAIDPDPGRRDQLAERVGAAAFASLAEAIETAGDTFDAVDIGVPHDLHESVTLEAFEAGKHVLLEKPMAPDPAACARILAAADAHPELVFLVAEQSQYWPDVVEAARLIADGAVGQPLFARACYWDRGVLPTDLGPDDPVPWRFRLDRAGGGLAIDGGAHWIRPLRMLLGEVEAVVGVTGRHVERMEGESWFQALLRFRSGATATFEGFASNAPAAPAELFRVTGTEGELVIPGPDFRDAEIRLHNAAHPDGATVYHLDRGRADSYGLELADFADAALDGAAPAAPAEDSLAELRTALALYRSVRSGRWEPIWDDAEPADPSPSPSPSPGSKD